MATALASNEFQADLGDLARAADLLQISGSQQLLERVRAFASKYKDLTDQRLPYAWEVTQDRRTFLVTAQEFTRRTYERGSFKPLFDK